MRTKQTIIMIVSVVLLGAAGAAVVLMITLGALVGLALWSGLVMLVLGLYRLAVAPWQHHWGATPEEVAREMPGDELLEATGATTRAITIAAPPERIWPWLVQIGYGRGGWYSYDQLDMNRPSVDRIVPELQSLAVGDVMPTHPGGGFEVRELEPDHTLVLYADRALMNAQAEKHPEGLDDSPPNLKATGTYLENTLRGDFQASWAFVLEPNDKGGTHLVERFRGRMPLPENAPTAARMGPKVAGNMLVFGLFVMVRRQMTGIRDRVEGRPIGRPWFSRVAPQAPAPGPTPA